MILAEPRLPFGFKRRHAFPQARPHIEFDHMALAIIEAHGLDAREALQRPGQRDGGVLPAGEEDEGAIFGGGHLALLDGDGVRLKRPFRAQVDFVSRSGGSAKISRSAQKLLNRRYRQRRVIITLRNDLNEF